MTKTKAFIISFFIYIPMLALVITILEYNIHSRLAIGYVLSFIILHLIAGLYFIEGLLTGRIK